MMQATATKSFLGDSRPPLLAIIPVVNLLFVSPLQVLEGNSEYIAHLHASLVIFWLAIACSSVSLLSYFSVLFFLTRARKARLFKVCEVGGALLAAIACFTTATTIFFPLTGTAGQVEAQSIPLDLMNLCAAIALSTLGAWVSAKGAGSFVTRLCLIMALLAGALSVASFLRSQNQAKAENPWRVSTELNLFVISFDGISRNLALELLAEKPSLATSLKDLIIFEKVASNAPSTNASITAELSGRDDLKASFVNEAAMFNEMDKATLLHNHLAMDGVIVTAYGNYRNLFEDRVRSFKEGELAIDNKLSVGQGAAELLSYGFARALGPGLAPRQKLLRSLLAKEDLEGQKLADRLRNHAGADWDIPNIRSIEDFELYLGALEKGGPRPVAHFMHWLFTHSPVDFDADCRYRSDNSEWHAKNQNRRGAKAEAECALIQFSLFIQRLRDMGVYENSLIVLKSDHGAVSAFGDHRSAESFQVRGNPLWGLARYTPLLALKPIGSGSGKLRADQRPAALSDLAVTLCMALIQNDPQRECERYSGANLLGPNEGLPNTLTYNLARHSTSSYMMDEHEPVTVPRGDPFVTLVDFLSSELLTKSVACDEIILIETGVAWNNGATDNESWVLWQNGGRAFLKLARPNCAQASIRVSWNHAASEILAVNGESWPFEVESIDGNRHLRINLAELPLGQSDVTLEFAGGTPTAFLIESD